jgi:pimeloyl-ACP methyl ester carboxylesterase
MASNLWRQLDLAIGQEQGQVALTTETVAYTLCEVRSRQVGQQAAYSDRRPLRGNLNVYVPGHGQSAGAARNLLAAIAVLSPSGTVWSIDIAPPKGGDQVRAAALVKLVSGRMADEFPSAHGELEGHPPRATLFGWSHGATEALLAAELAPDLFDHVVGLCPTGLVARSTADLMHDFAMECLHVAWHSAADGEPALGRALRIGTSLLVGVRRDATLAGSFQRVVDDIRWATQQVTGPSYAYPGTVVLLFAKDDQVIHWRDVFPRCREPRDVRRYVRAVRDRDFPKVRQFAVQILEGDHMGPEAHALAYVDSAFDLLYPQRISSRQRYPQRRQRVRLIPRPRAA